MKTKSTFESLIKQLADDFDLATVFDDFLTMSIALCGINPKGGRSFDEQLLLKTLEKYKGHPLRFNFTKMLSSLTFEITERIESKQSPDILGEFYESKLNKESSPEELIPYPVCVIMARGAIQNAEKTYPGRSFQILDPYCSSGRMLYCLSNVSRNKHQYFGVEKDMIKVKMAALTLFLSSVFNTEVMCADSNVPGDFKVSYKISFWPFGIFRQEVKEKSQLWRVANRIVVPSEMYRVSAN